MFNWCLGKATISKSSATKKKRLSVIVTCEVRFTVRWPLSSVNYPWRPICCWYESLNRQYPRNSLPGDHPSTKIIVRKSGWYLTVIISTSFHSLCECLVLETMNPPSPPHGLFINSSDLIQALTAVDVAAAGVDLTARLRALLSGGAADSSDCFSLTSIAIHFHSGAQQTGQTHSLSRSLSLPFKGLLASNVTLMTE